MHKHILEPAAQEFAEATSQPPFLYELGPEGARMLAGLMEQAFREEDKPIIEAAYANLDGTDFWDAGPISLRVDGGGTRARRMIQKLLKEEEAAR